tara:strand:- start:177 stop:359 length:183 start_codon:yes stop_codon:yes gene_type:complete
MSIDSDSWVWEPEWDILATRMSASVARAMEVRRGIGCSVWVIYLREAREGRDALVNWLGG